MASNVNIYDRVREVPKEAQTIITGGKLKGMTDINPMWRIKTLTEVFGASGYGWWTENVKFEVINGAGGEVAVMCTMELWVRNGEEQSKAIFGVGGAMFVKTENGKLVSNDEAYKMAYTDAISVACKALGIGADVYYNKDRTKYTSSEESGKPKRTVFAEATEAKLRELNINLDTVARHFGTVTDKLTEAQVCEAIGIQLEALERNGRNRG